jgi:hypothetical protein
MNKQASLKTQKNNKNVDDFLNTIADEQQRDDARAINGLMKQVTEQQPKMWGDSIVGYGTYHYKYALGREGDWMKIAFSPRKGKLTLYLMDGTDKHQTDLDSLGKHKTAVACLYIKRLADVDKGVLRKIIKKSYEGLNMGEQE